MAGFAVKNRGLSFHEHLRAAWRLPDRRAWTAAAGF